MNRTTDMGMLFRKNSLPLTARSASTSQHHQKQSRKTEMPGAGPSSPLNVAHSVHPPKPSAAAERRSLTSIHSRPIAEAMARCAAPRVRWAISVPSSTSRASPATAPAAESTIIHRNQR